MKTKQKIKKRLGVLTIAVALAVVNTGCSVDDNGKDVPTTTTEPEYVANKSLCEVTTSDIGWRLCNDGRVYEPTGELYDGITEVAKIFYVGSDNGEEPPYNHGLALAVRDADNGKWLDWMNPIGDAGHSRQANTDFKSESGLQYNLMHFSYIDTYPAFKAAIANNGTDVPPNCSEW